MKSKTILGADGATKMRQITVQEQQETMQRREKPQEREYLPLWK